MKKRILAIILTVVCVCSFSFTALAAEETTPITITLNGEAINCERYGQSAVIIEGRTLVPLRAIFEALDATVEWDNATQTVTSTKNDITILVAIGSNTMTKNGESIALDVPAQLINSRTMVPVRAIAEAFGVNVEWNDKAQTVVLATPIMLDEVKTLGELEDHGYVYQSYFAFNSNYIFTYATKTRSYDVTVVVPEETNKALNDLSIFDDDYEEKQISLRRPLVITEIKARNEEPLSAEVLSAYVGKTAKCLIEDGFEIIGFEGFNGEYTFSFVKDYQEYAVYLDDTAKKIMDNREFGDDSYETNILPCVITKIEYSRPY